LCYVNDLCTTPCSGTLGHHNAWSAPQWRRRSAAISRYPPTSTRSLLRCPQNRIPRSRRASFQGGRPRPKATSFPIGWKSRRRGAGSGGVDFQPRLRRPAVVLQCEDGDATAVLPAGREPGLRRRIRCMSSSAAARSIQRRPRARPTAGSISATNLAWP
jgi:hypothetical protein